jgi:hypothetical protein
MPCSLAAVCAMPAKMAGVRSFGGVLIRSRARFSSSVTATARATAPLWAAQRGLGQRRLAVLGLGVLAVLLVDVEGVRAEQDALGDRTDGARAVDRQGERGLLGAGERAGGHAGGLAQRLGVVALAALGVLVLGLGVRLRAQADRHHEGCLEARRSGQLRQLALGTRGAEGFQDAGQLAVVRLVHGLGARRNDEVPRPGSSALGDTDHDRVGPQAGRRGGAESQSSHGGEISLPM